MDQKILGQSILKTTNFGLKLHFLFRNQEDLVLSEQVANHTHKLVPR